MKNALKLGVVTFALLSAGGIYANDHTVHVGGQGHTHRAEAKTTVQGEMADGEIRKINKSTGKITVKHGEIKSVEMPPMTMVFGVADKAMLEGLKEGDKVKFSVKQEGSNYTVTEIKKAQ
jgi:Cu(I)/Ag(I) efflux system periplasmic protein CusF